MLLRLIKQLVKSLNLEDHLLELETMMPLALRLDLFNALKVMKMFSVPKQLFLIIYIE